jgi:hypothetical protein
VNAVAIVSPGIVPANMTEAMQLAEMMATAKLVPKDLQKSPADCLMVIQAALRWSMDPFAVAQECSVIQGKLMYSGKLVAGVVNARGNLTERLSYAYVGEGRDRTITVSGRLQGETAPRTVSVRIEQAATNNRVWQSQPDQQLMYHGCRVWARRHTPELMLGVWSPEEFDEPAPANGNTIEHAPASALPPIKRTREQIQSQAKHKRDETRERIPADLAQIETLHALERYKREVLTPEFMATLGTAQYAVEEMVGTREAELQSVNSVNADELTEEPEGRRLKTDKADYVRHCFDVIGAAKDDKSLLEWWNGREAKMQRRSAELTPEELRDLMDRVTKRVEELRTITSADYERQT